MVANPVTTLVRRITRDTNVFAGADGYAYFNADGIYLGATAAGTAPTEWAYAVAVGSIITQKLAAAIVAAIDDKDTDLEAWFDTHQDVLHYLGAEIDKRRAA